MQMLFAVSLNQLCVLERRGGVFVEWDRKRCVCASAPLREKTIEISVSSCSFKLLANDVISV